MTLQQFSSNSISEEVEKGFDFIIFHFEGYLEFPRNIMASELTTDQNEKKYQYFKIVLSREQALPISNSIIMLIVVLMHFHI